MSYYPKNVVFDNYTIRAIKGRLENTIERNRGSKYVEQLADGVSLTAYDGPDGICYSLTAYSKTFEEDVEVFRTDGQFYDFRFGFALSPEEFEAAMKVFLDRFPYSGDEMSL